MESSHASADTSAGLAATICRQACKKVNLVGSVAILEAWSGTYGSTRLSKCSSVAEKRSFASASISAGLAAAIICLQARND